MAIAFISSPFLVMIQSWWLLASALRVSGLLSAVVRRFVARRYLEERRCGPFWINRPPDCEGRDPVTRREPPKQPPALAL